MKFRTDIRVEGMTCGSCAARPVTAAGAATAALLRRFQGSEGSAEEVCQVPLECQRAGF